MTDMTVPKGKNFWDKPEGLWGMCISAGVIGGLIWFLTWFVPMMLKLGLGILGVAVVWGTIAVLGYTVFTDNALRQAVLLKIQVLSKNLRSAVISEDPIAIRRIIQSKAKHRWDEFKELGGPVKASKLTVKGTTDEFRGMIEELQAEYNLLNRDPNGDKDRIQEILAQMGMLDKELADMDRLAKEMEIMDATLDMAGKKIKKIIDRTDFEINIMEKKMKAAAAVSSSWKKFRSIFAANSAEEELKQEAERASQERLYSDLGEIDQCMTDFKDVLTVLNNKDAINAEMARAKMEKLKTSTQTLSLDVGTPSVSAASMNKVVPIRVGVPLSQKLPK